MKENIVYIKLLNGPRPGESQGEKNSNGCRFDNRAEGFGEIDSRTLMKTFCNETSFVACYSTIWITFDPKYPFAPNDIRSRRGRNKVPSMIT